MRTSLIFLFTFLIMVSASAQNDLDSLYELSLEELMNIRVITASRTEQTLTEVPGTVSVVTQKQIRERGYRTLKDVLTAIPGFEIIQNNDEYVISTRGVYNTTNQKILLMRDGVRLNEGFFDRSQVSDFSIMIDNVERIEIIRGAGASLYGNAAASAVINLISRKDDYQSIRMMMGNHGQKGVDISASKKLDDEQYFTGYARVYGNKGEVVERTLEEDYNAVGLQQPGEMRLNHSPVSLDAGAEYKRDDFRVGFNYGLAQYQSHWSNGGQNIDPDRVNWVNGIQTDGFHLFGDYTPRINDKWSATLHHHFDHESITVGNVTDVNAGYTSAPYARMFQLYFKGNRIGGNYFLTYSYDKGNLLFGGEYENRNYIESYQLTNGVDTTNFRFVPDITPPGNEWRGAGYFQALHKFNDLFQVNVGARYDFAQGFKSTFNPRMALIFSPHRQLVVKGIYARAFQAPGYFYRTQGSVGPEILESMQLVLRYTNGNFGFLELTAFHNNMNNIIRNNGVAWVNVGKTVAEGIELEGEANVFRNLIGFNFNYSFLMPVASSSDEQFRSSNIRDGEFQFLSQHTAVMGMTYRPNPKFSINVNSRWRSQFYATSIIEPEPFRLPSFTLVNAMISASDLLPKTSVDLSVHNLFDKEYVLGGDASRPSPIPQPGRWVQLTFRYEFTK